MCGIAGFFSYEFNHSHSTLQSMGAGIERRGPDGEGYFIKDIKTCRVGLVHKRLSIIDLSEQASQPMHSEFSTIVFNGEIYNYEEIKLQLIRERVKFTTQSDTEVILKAYEAWGIDKCITSLKGMFSFCIIDWRKETAYLVRDRAGVKPLLYLAGNDCFAFASTLNGLSPYKSLFSVNRQSLAYYLQSGYVPGNTSIYNEVSKVQPGCYISICLKTKKINETKYWSVYSVLNKSEKLQFHNEKERIDFFEEKLIKAFKYRMVSDVPVGIFLSGGYDSTAVLALLSKYYTGSLKTFTIGFNEEKYDESRYAKIVANHFGSEHFELICSTEDAKVFIPEIAKAYDEPYGDSSAIPTMLLSQFARKHVKVALSADGGDELFGGYNKHLEGLYNMKRMELFLRKTKSFSSGVSVACKALSNIINSPIGANKLRKISYIIDNKLDFHEIQALANIYTSNRTMKNILSYDDYDFGSYHKEVDIIPNEDPLNYILGYDFSTYMVDDVLVKVDRATMHMSLEGREPFLDHELIEAIFSLEGLYKIRNGQKKFILKEIVHRYIPSKFVDRPKKGFSLPVKEWMRTSLKDYFLDSLSNYNLSQDTHFNTKEIIKLRDKYFKGETQHFETLWYIHSYLQWKIGS